MTLPSINQDMTLSHTGDSGGFDPHIVSKDLDQPGDADVERIAALGVVMRRTGAA